MDNGHEPATKADLTPLVDQLCFELRHGFDDLKKTLRDMQSELLKALNCFADSADEKRINLPPQAQ